jgi:hypothetical protein
MPDIPQTKSDFTVAIHASARGIADTPVVMKAAVAS